MTAHVMRNIAIGLAALSCFILIGVRPVVAAPMTAEQARSLGASACASPSASFDPLHASSTELSYYGLPLPHGRDAQSMAHWVDVVHHAKTRVCDAPIQGTRRSHPRTPTRVANARVAGPLTISTNATSPNWSGVEATSGGFDWVFADWTVPCYNSANSPTYSTALQWIGIGGDPGNLWQAGTETDWQVGGAYFWYEYVIPPDGGVAQQYVHMYVACGNLVNAQVDYNQTYANQSYAFLENYTTGTYWSTHISFTPDSGTAEWIDERACTGVHCSCLTQLADYVQTNWTYAQARSQYVAGHSIEPASYFSGYFLDMHDQSTGQYLSGNTGFFADGKSFTDYWAANGRYNGC